MGVPALFRYLQLKYPKIIEGLGDRSEPGPLGPSSGSDCDNLYLDMNSIVHPCSHPEGRSPPETEEKIMVEIINYTERIVQVVQPQKLLYLAIDGVAPRAKMNQQRGRRFRAAREASTAAQELKQAIIDWEAMGNVVPYGVLSKKSWDQNVITPGTRFMSLLAASLRYWVVLKMNSDPTWKNLHVIVSDSSVAGEGEHKIMDWVRRQRTVPGYNANTRHVIYGNDADLIMLALVSHEPHFRVLRENLDEQRKMPAPCYQCGGLGHNVSGCTTFKKYGLDRSSEPPNTMANTNPISFIYLNVTILREYLNAELTTHHLPFTFDLELAIDDWVFLIFMVGNDFLPNIPSLDIKQGAITTLLSIWKTELHKMGGFLTDNGSVNLSRLQIILEALGKQEGDIFILAHQEERQKQMYQSPTHALSVGLSNLQISTSSKVQTEKRSKTEEHNDIHLWEPGYQARYYKSKFSVDWSNDERFRDQIAQAYIEGLCWVLAYYYHGTPSWKWFYPYHYAPFAGDLKNVSSVEVRFDRGQPLKAFEQQMAVFPPTSRCHIPEPFHYLMLKDDSPIIDLYPEDFEIDLNGQALPWKGVTLLPFFDERKLVDAMKPASLELTREEVVRNLPGTASLFVSDRHSLYGLLSGLYVEPREKEVIPLDATMGSDLAGQILAGTARQAPGGTYISPLSSAGFRSIPNNTVVSVSYYIPKLVAPHRSALLREFKAPPEALIASDHLFVASGGGEFGNAGSRGGSATRSAYGRGGFRGQRGQARRVY
ncbi:5'-3' exoribonuclease 2 [Tulasnella sp. 332]|nr:5'-3' exoribonuclease 2 [Tulasnella sp. 332]